MLIFSGIFLAWDVTHPGNEQEIDMFFYAQDDQGGERITPIFQGYVVCHVFITNFAVPYVWQ